MPAYKTANGLRTSLAKILMVILFINTGTVFAQNTGDNLVLNRPGSASSVESADYPASNAFDGDPLTKWSSSSSGYKQWVGVDLGFDYIIDEVVIKWADTYYSGSFDIQISGDNLNWSTIATIDNANARTVDSIKNLHGTARYVRFNGRGRAGGNAGSRYRIGELEVYGAAPEPVTPEQQRSIDTVTNRLVHRLVPGAVNESSLAAIIAAQNADGSWPTIDYDTVALNFPAGAHLNNLKAMAIAYRTPGNTYYQSSDMLQRILLGLRFFMNKNPQSTNWWYNDIGAPQDYMIPVLLLKGEVPEDTLVNYSRYLRDQLARFAGEAKNLTWIASIAMYKSCIENDYRLLDASFRAIYSSLVIVPGWDDEGIKLDNSFHQHHAQLYSGGYGMSIMTDFAGTIQLADGTEFINSISADNLRVLSNVLLKGHQLFGYRNMIDFGSIGRDISRQTTSTYNNISADVLSKMGSIDTGHAADYQAWKDHLSGASFPTAYQGNNYFWKSDIMTQHGANFYLSAKVISTRTYGTESLNGENVKGHNLPLGATNIVTDGLEYNTIAPVWDWCRIPGTTTVQNQDSATLNGYLIGTNEFAGGASDAKGGVIAFENNYGGVAAKKAYFFMDNAMLCLGAGVSSVLNDPVYTSVNQCFLSGDIVVNAAGTTSTFTDERQSFNDLNWVYHRRVGYIFPATGQVTLQNTQQTGTWRSINIDGSTDTLSRPVFSLWADHGIHPTNGHYAYIVVPDKSLQDFEDYASQNRFSVLSNDTLIQAVRNDSTHQYGIIFYHPGVIDLGDGLAIRSNKSAVVLVSFKPQSGGQLQSGGAHYSIAVADPLYKAGASIELAVSKKLTGAGAVWDGNSTLISLSLPGGDSTGSARKVDLFEEITLPVGAGDFQVQRVKTGVALSWNVYSRRPHPVFDILHGTDAGQLTRLGSVDEAKTNTDGDAMKFSFFDPSPATGENYYRLRQLDDQGNVIFLSPVRTVRMDEQTPGPAVRIYPNPVTDYLSIYTNRQMIDKAEILSVTGSIIKKYALDEKGAGVHRQLNVSFLPAGVYFLRLSGKSGQVAAKFIKK